LAAQSRLVAAGRQASAAVSETVAPVRRHLSTVAYNVSQKRHLITDSVCEEDSAIGRVRPSIGFQSFEPTDFWLRPQLVGD